jgi:hypothetical protein
MLTPRHAIILSIVLMVVSIFLVNKGAWWIVDHLGNWAALSATLAMIIGGMVVDLRKAWRQLSELEAENSLLRQVARTVPEEECPPYVEGEIVWREHP